MTIKKIVEYARRAEADLFPEHFEVVDKKLYLSIVTKLDIQKVPKSFLKMSSDRLTNISNIGILIDAMGRNDLYDIDINPFDGDEPTSAFLRIISTATLHFDIEFDVDAKEKDIELSRMNFIEAIYDAAENY